jgi:hypothetical protein
MARKVLLVTTVDWTSTARYAGGFAAASWSVDVLCPRRAPARKSRYVGECHLYRPLMAVASLRKALAKADPDLIVPCDDRAVGMLLKLYRKELAAKGETAHLVTLLRRSLGSPENFEEMLPRAASMQASAKLGIATPDTVAVANLTELEETLSKFGLPAVLKVDGSWGGEGVAIARTKDEAIAAFHRLSRPVSRLRNVARALKRKDAHFLLDAVFAPKPVVNVQTFVAGRSANSAFACWQGEITAEIYYDVLVSDGPGGPPNVIRRVDCPQMAEASRKIAKHFGLSGIYGLDFIRDEAGDVHLIEINPRTTQGGTLAFGEGRDLPAALASSVMRSDATRRPSIANDVVAFFPREWERDAASPYFLTGHHDVPWDDPAILRLCFDSVSKSHPARRSLMDMLALPADARKAPVPMWRRAFTLARG